MSPASSPGCIHDSLVEGAQSCRRDNGSASAVVQLVRRSVTSHQRGVILGSVLGILGGLALLAAIFFLARWLMHRQSNSVLVIQQPLHPLPVQQEEKNIDPYPRNPHPPVKRTNTPDPGTYMPNHPYALTYGRRDSFASSHPSAPAPAPANPPALPSIPSNVPSNVPALPPLIVSHLVHPYSQQPQSAAPASTIYESFLSPDSPEATIRVPSPLPSTIAGAQAYPPSQYDTADTSPPTSAFSNTATNSSTAPLRRITSPPPREQERHPVFES